MRKTLAFLTSAVIFPIVFLIQAVGATESIGAYIAACAAAGALGAGAVSFWIYHWFARRGFARWLRITIIGAVIGVVIALVMEALPRESFYWKLKVFTAFILWQAIISSQYQFARKRTYGGGAPFIQLRPAGVTVVIIFAAASFSPSIAAPPQLVRTIPEDGALNVSSGLKEFIVEFDQPLKPNTLEFTGIASWFPEQHGEPVASEDGQTYTLPIELRSNREYVIRIQGARNFQDEEQIPRTISFATPFKDSSRSPKRLAENRNQLAVIQLRNALLNSYSYRDRLDIDWEERIDKWERTLILSKTQRAFALNLLELLRVAEDAHIWVKLGSERRSAAQIPYTMNVSLPGLRNAVDPWNDHGAAMSTGRINKTIGYVRIASLGPTGLIDILRGASALPRLFRKRSLVVDIRENNGGAEHFAKAIAGCFVDSPTIYAQSRRIDPENPNALTELQPRKLRPTPYAPRFAGPIAALSGQRVMSSAESFLLMLKSSSQTQVFGDRTRGSSGNPKKHSLGNGIDVYLPSWIATDAEGKPFEGVGIAPDHSVPAPSADATEDPVLEAALDWLQNR